MFIPQWIRVVISEVVPSVLVITVFVTACGGGGAEQAPMERSEPAVDRPSPTPTMESPLKRRDVAPAGVEALVSKREASGDGSPCHLGPLPVEPEVQTFCDVMPSYCWICAQGFEPNQYVEFSFWKPQGKAWPSPSGPRPVDDLGVAQSVLIMDPHFDPAGEYKVAAHQGTTGAFASFTLREATEPTILVDPRRGPPGDPFAITLAGFPPRQPVVLHLFRRETSGWVYLTSLEAETDERGRHLYALQTQPSDPEGKYRVATVPRSHGYDTFDVGR
jgi:hypothetical protein